MEQKIVIKWSLEIRDSTIPQRLKPLLHYCFVNISIWDADSNV